MPIRSVHYFQGCGAAIDTIRDENGGVASRVFVISDPQKGEQWRYPMEEEGARVLGGQMMGLGDAKVATPSDMRAEVARHAPKNGG